MAASALQNCNAFGPVPPVGELCADADFQCALNSPRILTRSLSVRDQTHLDGADDGDFADEHCTPGIFLTSGKQLGWIGRTAMFWRIADGYPQE
jgi:hypothetical protein